MITYQEAARRIVDRACAGTLAPGDLWGVIGDRIALMPPWAQESADRLHIKVRPSESNRYGIAFAGALKACEYWNADRWRIAMRSFMASTIGAAVDQIEIENPEASKACREAVTALLSNDRVFICAAYDKLTALKGTWLTPEALRVVEVAWRCVSEVGWTATESSWWIFTAVGDDPVQAGKLFDAFLAEFRA